MNREWKQRRAHERRHKSPKQGKQFLHQEKHVRDGKHDQPHRSEADEEVLLLLETFVPHIAPGEGEVAEQRNFHRLFPRARGRPRHGTRWALENKCDQKPEEPPSNRGDPKRESDADEFPVRLRALTFSLGSVILVSSNFDQFAFILNVSLNSLTFISTRDVISGEPLLVLLQRRKIGQFGSLLCDS